MKDILNKSQLTQISKFIKAKGVIYADVNAEMTDHIASEVEELLRDENLEFLDALKQVFSRYDRFHFMRIEEEQQKKLEKQSYYSFKNGFINFFSFPKIIFTLCLFFSFYQLSDMGYIEYLGYFYLFFSLILVSSLFYLKIKWLGKGRFLQLSKLNWVSAFGINLGIQVMFRLDLLYDSWGSFLASVFSTLLFLVLFIAIELYVNEFRKIKRQYV